MSVTAPYRQEAEKFQLEKLCQIGAVIVYNDFQGLGGAHFCFSCFVPPQLARH